MPHLQLSQAGHNADGTDTNLACHPPDEPHFICRLTCPAVIGEGGRSFNEQVQRCSAQPITLVCCPAKICSRHLFVAAARDGFGLDRSWPAATTWSSPERAPVLQIFTGEGRNKRAAEHAAASAALAFIDSLGMLAPPQPQMQPLPAMAPEAPVTAEEVRHHWLP